MRPKKHKYYTWQSVSTILHHIDRDYMWKAVEEFELHKCLEKYIIFNR